MNALQGMQKEVIQEITYKKGYNIQYIFTIIA